MMHPADQNQYSQPAIWILYFGLPYSFPHTDDLCHWDLPLRISAPLPPSFSVMGIW